MRFTIVRLTLLAALRRRPFIYPTMAVFQAKTEEVKEEGIKQEAIKVRSKKGNIPNGHPNKNKHKNLTHFEKVA